MAVGAKEYRIGFGDKFDSARLEKMELEAGFRDNAIFSSL
jgi:hypothetical protein